MKALLYWLTGFLPCRIISDGDRPYLERYYLCTLFNVRFYLHRFVDSDPGRGLHDHPWPWAASIVLSGWYWEETRGFETNPAAQALAEALGTKKGTIRKKVRWLNWLTGDSFHRVVLPLDWSTLKPSPCWTLFFHRATNVKPWGFLYPMDSSPNVVVWMPHNYPQDGASASSTWWNEVPIGKLQTRRQPCP
jgi:hypothetical protein